jgi:hypothetical protein
MNTVTKARAPRLSLYPLTSESAERFGLAHLRTLLPASVSQLVCRVPEPSETQRWRSHSIGGRTYRVAQPVTFTPYAAARACSARCLFCSENLRTQRGSAPASLLRPGPDYFRELERALRELEGLPLSYSLSGLETTDDADFMCALLDRLSRHAERSPVEQRVLYSNGAGFAGPERERLISRLCEFELSWLELSRHHFDAVQNQAIMRFRDGLSHRDGAGFDAMLVALCERLAVKLVCIVQRGGVDSAQALCGYLAWAKARGVRSVIVREFSKLDASYRQNGTARYIDSARIDVQALLLQTSNALGDALSLHTVTAGYYFWNVIGSYQGMEVIFEVADYAVMRAQHDSERVYKLVFHANGALCAGWEPDEHVLLDARVREQHQGEQRPRSAALRTRANHGS